MKKESLSVMTVKILLAVLLFAGVGTIIVGGGYLIGEYYKTQNNNKIIKPITSEIIDFKVQGYSQTFSYESASMAMDCGFIDGKIASGEFQGKKLIVFLPNHTTEKYPKKDEIIKIFITNEKAILRNKFNEIYKKEFPYYCLEDKDMDGGKKNDFVFQEMLAFKMPSEINQSDTSNWQTYRNEEFGFGVVFDEEYKNIWESKTINYTNEDILARTDFYFKNHQTHIFSNIRIYDSEWFHKNSLIEEEYAEEMQKNIKIAWKNKDKGLSNYLGTYLGENDDYVFTLGISPNGCNATEFLCSLSSLSGKMIVNSFFVIENDQSDTSNWQTYRNEEFGFEFKYPSEFSPQKVFQIEPDGMIFSVGNTIYNFSVSRYSEKYVSEKKAIYTEEYCSRDGGYNDCIFWATHLSEWNGDSKIFISKSNGDNCKEESDNYKSRCFSCDVVLFDNEKAIEKIIFPLPNEDYFHWRLTIKKGSEHFYLDLASNFHELARKEGVVSQDFSLQQLILNQKDKEPKEIFNQILSTFKFTEK